MALRCSKCGKTVPEFLHKEWAYDTQWFEHPGVDFMIETATPGELKTYHIVAARSWRFGDKENRALCGPMLESVPQEDYLDWLIGIDPKRV